MLLVRASSSCDVCLEPFQLRGESSPIVRAPCAIDCGHIFCSTCIDSFARLACPLCHHYFDPRAVRRLHLDVSPQTPDARSTRVGRPSSGNVTSSKEYLKDRIISIVRNGADGDHYRALIQETCTWLKEQTPEEHWDLRTLYLLLIRYHQMHKDKQAATVSLHEKTKLYQDALREAEKRQQEISELKQTISSEGPFTNQQVFGPIVECPDDTPITDHFSPLLVHLSPMPSTINAASPSVQNTAESVEDEGSFRPRPQSSEDGYQTSVEYSPPLVSTRATKSMVIGAATTRSYDMTASNTSTSLPHPTPSAFYSRRHEKEKEKQGELSRNNSFSGTDRVSLSRIRALQEKLVPESGDEVERTRSNRRHLFNAILADAPTPQSSPAPTPPPPPPPPQRPVATSRASSAVQEIVRERERRRRQSSENRAPETPNTTAPPHLHQPRPQSQPQLQFQIRAQRLAHPRPSVQSLKDAINLHGGEDGMQRRPGYPEWRSAAERRPSIGKPQWQRGDTG